MHLPIQIVDENDEPIGVASTPEAHEKGWLHRIVYIMVEDPDGQILLQKRSSDMDAYPNCWDVSSAGHVDGGEGYLTAANRELAEELGVQDVELEEIGTYQSSRVFKGRKLNRFNKVYKVVVPSDTKFVIQQSEVTAVQWFRVADVKQLIRDSPDQVAGGLVDAFSHFYV